MIGRVFKSTGSFYSVKTEAGLINCRIKGKLRLAGIKSTNPVSVGDFVEIELENEKEGLILSIKDRKNYIVRKSVNLSKRTHIIASNIDQAVLIVTLISPKTFTQFIDRFLAAAEAYSIPLVLVFNKVDLYGEEELSDLLFLSQVYQDMDYEILHTSAEEKLGLEDFEKILKDKTTLLSGHSGVGKSTLVNLVQSDLDLKTKPISDSHDQGQHTTTFAEMYELDMGGYIVDSPGIKGFGTVNMKKEEIGDYFRDIFAFSASCKFNNCMHVDEPQCAVKKALEENQLSYTRYESYLSMIKEIEEEGMYRSDNFNS
tara:strand:- start:123 stop:1064 length:942 start_codon:yes stop_codon:yes gene_type:complete